MPYASPFCLITHSLRPRSLAQILLLLHLLVFNLKIANSDVITVPNSKSSSPSITESCNFQISEINAIVGLDVLMIQVNDFRMS